MLSKYEKYLNIVFPIAEIIKYKNPYVIIALVKATITNAIETV